MKLNMMPDDSDPCERRVMVSVPLDGDYAVHQLDQLIPLYLGDKISWIRQVTILDPQGQRCLTHDIFERSVTVAGTQLDVLFGLEQHAVVSLSNNTNRIVVVGNMPGYEMTFMVGIAKPIYD